MNKLKALWTWTVFIYSMLEDLIRVFLFIGPILLSCPVWCIKLMKGNHCGRCSITHSPVDPLAPLLFMINCQLSPGGLNWQVNQTGHLLRGMCRTDDDAPSSLISNPPFLKSLYEDFLRRCRRLTSTLPLPLFLHQHVERKHAQRAVQPQCGGGDVRGNLAGHDSEPSEKHSPLASPCVFPIPSSVKSDMWSGTCDSGIGGVHRGSRHQHPAEWSRANLSV